MPNFGVLRIRIPETRTPRQRSSRISESGRFALALKSFSQYASPFPFTGKIKRVTVDVSGAEPPRDLVQEAEIEMARQ